MLPCLRYKVVVVVAVGEVEAVVDSAVVVADLVAVVPQEIGNARQNIEQHSK
jgi:hypothetical protein